MESSADTSNNISVDKTRQRGLLNMTRENFLFLEFE